MTKYRKPPIIERAFSMGVQIEEEFFVRHAEIWKQCVKQDLPELETITMWQIAVTEKDGMPQIDNTQQMSIRQRFWKGKKQNRDRGIQIRKDRVAFNLIGSPGNPRSFEDLQTFINEWQPKWASCFEVKCVSGITLEYVNIISATTMPAFASQNKIDIANVLSCYLNVPAPAKTLIPPYSFHVNALIEGDIPLIFTAQLNNVGKTNQQVELRLLFKATTEAPGRSVSLDQTASELKYAHGIILQKFPAFFTPQALKSFDPYDCA